MKKDRKANLLQTQIYWYVVVDKLNDNGGIVSLSSLIVQPLRLVHHFSISSAQFAQNTTT